MDRLGQADRVVGTLLGLAAGDRIGGPTRMALRVAESVLARDEVDVADIGRRYVEWWRGGAFDTGPTTAGVLALVASGSSFEEASARVDAAQAHRTAGCNPAHRIAPIAMCAPIDDLALDEAARAEARLTHRAAMAGEVAAAVARLCRALIRGTAWPDALAAVAVGRPTEVRAALLRSPSDERSTGGHAPAVLHAAVHFLDEADSLAGAMAAVRFAGPRNYCPVLVGSIGGARWGRDQVPDDLVRDHGALVPRLRAAALALAEPWGRSEEAAGTG